MPLTARQLNRATLDRQLLSQREPLGVAEGLRRIFAIQAQEPASVYLALWARLADLDATEVDTVLAQRTVVKASLMRITLHAVHAEDHPAGHAAMVRSLRGSRLHDRRFSGTGLTIPQIDALLPELLAFTASPRADTEIRAWLDGRLGELGKPAWWAIRTFAPLLHLPTGGPWAFGPRKSFVSAPADGDPAGATLAADQLLRRYLAGFGPASALDFAGFTLFTRAAARETAERLGDELVRLEGPDGAELLDLAGASVPPAETRAPPRLLPMWDSVLLAYADRSRIIPPLYRRVVIRQNGDVLPTLLVDGYVAGVWRASERGIEATAFAPLSDEAWAGLDAEATALAGFLAGRDPAVYRRYARWWDALPPGETRVLAA